MEMDFMRGYLAFWMAVLGAVMGSFLDCAAWRLTHGESVWKGRSHCGDCGRTLKAGDLIPLVSYLRTGGRCRYCGAKIPADAFWAEAAGALSFGSLTWKLGPGLPLAMWLIFAALLLLLSLLDCAERVLPDRLLALAALNRLFFLLLSGDLPGQLPSVLAGALCVSAPLLLLVLAMDRILGRETMGGGDIKLLFVTGMYLHWAQMFLLLLTACILGIGGGLLAVRRGGSRGRGIPFGPYIAAAALVTVLFGQPLISWYAGLLR